MSIPILVKNIKNLLPYFLLIAIYFFFVNLEARKDFTNNTKSEQKKELPVNKLVSDEKQHRIKIPVVPYRQ